MGAIEAVLFDLDGVLVDSREVWFHLMRAAGRHFGHPEPTRQGFLDTFGQGVDADIRVFFPGTGFQELDDFYNAHFEAHPDGARVLDALAASGRGTCVVTNTATVLARDILGWAGLAPKDLVGSSDVAQAKPAPDMVLLGCQRLGVAPERAVMVGDSIYDRDAARAAGVCFAGYGGIEGDWTLGSLDELLERVEGA